MVDTVRTQAQLLAFLHPNIPNPLPDATVLVAQAARDLIVSIPVFGTGGFFPGGPLTGSWPNDVIIGSGINHTDSFQVLVGADGAPVSGQGVAAMISRIANFATAGDSNAALYVFAANTHTGSPTGQPQALIAFVRQYNDADAVAYYGATLHQGGAVAYGQFLTQSNNNSAGGAVGIQLNVANLTGVDSPAYSTSFNRWGGYDVYSPGPNNAQAAVQVRAGIGGAWRVGVGILAGLCVSEADFRSDSSATISHDIRGTHTTDIDHTNSTATFYEKFDANFHIAKVAATDPRITFDASGYLQYSRGSQTFNVGIGAANPVVISAAPLVANQTGLSLAEGVTPTLRQVQWKLQSALVAADKVMVLV